MPEREQVGSLGFSLRSNVWKIPEKPENQPQSLQKQENLGSRAPFWSPGLNSGQPRMKVVDNTAGEDNPPKKSFPCHGTPLSRDAPKPPKKHKNTRNSTYPLMASLPHLKIWTFQVNLRLPNFHHFGWHNFEHLDLHQTIEVFCFFVFLVIWGGNTRKSAREGTARVGFCILVWARILYTSLGLDFLY